MHFQDRTIECLDCHQTFVFTAGEQEFYDRKGFREIPKRCKSCRDKRKNKRDVSGAVVDDNIGNRIGGGSGANAGGGGRNGYGGYGGERAERGGGRELFEATCAACGAPARVPFKPAANRPVYCRDCYQSRQAGY